MAFKSLIDRWRKYGPVVATVLARRLNIALEEAAALVRYLMIDLRLSPEAISRLEAEAIMRNYCPPETLILATDDCYLFSETGDCYVDLQGAYSANNAGNCNPRVTGANHQASTMTSILSRARRHRQLPLAAHELMEALGLAYKMLPMNSGCEAIEGAYLIAKLVFNRHERFKVKREGLLADGRNPKVVFCANNFHGRSSWAKAGSTNPDYRNPFAPNTLENEIVWAEFGNIGSLEAAFSRGDIFAFIVEPIQCEGGMNMPSDGYFQTVRELCDRYNVLLVIDEVQTGLGRTGKMIAMEHYLGRPDGADLIALGKSISGGQEVVSAILARPEYADLVRKSEHGSTFGGSPKAAATMRAAIRELQDRDLCRRAEESGAICLTGLKAVCQLAPGVIDVRGKGLAIGIEMAGHGADEVCARLRQSPFVYRGRKFAGCWTNATHGITDKTTVIRISPPLTIPGELLTAIMYSMAQAFRHPDPERFRAKRLEGPKTPAEMMTNIRDELTYLARRFIRFRNELRHG